MSHLIVRMMADCSRHAEQQQWNSCRRTYCGEQNDASTVNCWSEKMTATVGDKVKYAGAWLDNDWCTRHATLYSTRRQTESQYN